EHRRGVHFRWLYVLRICSSTRLHQRLRDAAMDVSCSLECTCCTWAWSGVGSPSCSPCCTCVLFGASVCGLGFVLGRRSPGLSFSRAGCSLGRHICRLGARCWVGVAGVPPAAA